MRQFTGDEEDIEEAGRLLAEPWMLETLKLNPSYVFWGVHEDYMMKDGSGWDSRVLHDSWGNFKANFGGLDELNECVNFYFEVDRPNIPCATCGGTGHHPDAQWITESWYRHSSPFTKPDQQERDSKAILARFGCDWESHKGVIGRGTLPSDEVLSLYGKPFLDHCIATMENGGEWHTALIQDEVDALWESRRLFDFNSKPSAAEVNAWAKQNRGIGHDAINSFICTKKRCERLGVPYTCIECDGHVITFTGPPYLALTVWILHPRKGCSRGVEIKNIKESELPDVFAYLSEAANRNAKRFEKITLSSLVK